MNEISTFYFNPLDGKKLNVYTTGHGEYDIDSTARKQIE